MKDGGPKPPDLIGIFHDDVAAPPDNPVDGLGVTLMMNVPGTGHHPIRDAIFASLDEARDVIDIVNPYIATPAVIRRFEAAARRGVRVRVVIPAEPRPPFPIAAFRSWFPQPVRGRRGRSSSTRAWPTPRSIGSTTGCSSGAATSTTSRCTATTSSTCDSRGPAVPGLAEPFFDELVAASTPAEPSTAAPEPGVGASDGAVGAVPLADGPRVPAHRTTYGGAPSSDALPGEDAVIARHERRRQVRPAQHTRPRSGPPSGSACRPSRRRPSDEPRSPSSRSAGRSWLAAASWPAFLPFVVGGLIAYQLLPVVDGLDSVLPRPLAALIAVLAAVAVVIGIAVIVLPPMAGAFVRFATDLPSRADIDAAIANLQAQIGTLPEGSLAVILPVVTTLAATIRDVFSGAGNGLDDIIRAGLGALLNAVGALLGLIVLPTWMLSVMSQKHRARIAIDTQITPGLRKDLWAVAAIFDRGAGAYLRGYIVTAFLVGLLTYVGAVLSPRIGGPQFGEPLALATFAGATQVIPIVGPLLGLLPAALILPIDAERAVVYLAIYLIAKYAGRVDARLARDGAATRRPSRDPRPGRRDARPVRRPRAAAVGARSSRSRRTSIRYFHGRLSEPPRPAGVLPRTAAPSSAATASTAPAPVPSAYRPATAPPPIDLSGSQPAAPTSVTRRRDRHGR